MDPLRCTELLHARAQKLQLLPEVQSNFRRYHGIRDVWLSNLVFAEFFRLFERKLRLALLAWQPKSLISIAFLSRRCDSMRTKYFPCNFFSLSSFVFTLLAYQVVSLTASEELLLTFHYTLAF